MGKEWGRSCGVLNTGRLRLDPGSTVLNRAGAQPLLVVGCRAEFACRGASLTSRPPWPAPAPARPCAACALESRQCLRARANRRHGGAALLTRIGAPFDQGKTGTSKQACASWLPLAGMPMRCARPAASGLACRQGLQHLRHATEAGGRAPQAVDVPGQDAESLQAGLRACGHASVELLPVCPLPGHRKCQRTLRTGRSMCTCLRHRWSGVMGCVQSQSCRASSAGVLAAWLWLVMLRVRGRQV